MEWLWSGRWGFSSAASFWVGREFDKLSVGHASAPQVLVGASVGQSVPLLAGQYRQAAHAKFAHFLDSRVADPGLVHVQLIQQRKRQLVAVTACSAATIHAFDISRRAEFCSEK